MTNDSKNDPNVPILPKGLYDYYYEEYSTFDKEDKENKQIKCWHLWKKYVGFNEKYEFCDKCDLKKPYED